MRSKSKHRRLSIRLPADVVFDGDGRFVTAILRPAKRPSGVEIQKLLRRVLRAIRANWPAVAPTTMLRRHVEALEASARAYFEGRDETQFRLHLPERRPRPSCEMVASKANEVFLIRAAFPP